MPSIRSLFIPPIAIALAAVSTAAAQAPDTPLYTLRGDPIPYRIDVPEGWPVSRVEYAQSGGDKPGYMLTVGDDRVVVKVYTLDIIAPRENGASEALRRRLVTQMILRSDSLIYSLLEGAGAQAQRARMRDEVREIRTLRGQRAGYLSARFDVDGKPGWMEMHVTLSEGILYVLSFATMDENPAPYAPLFARVRESLVFAPAPDERSRR